MGVAALIGGAVVKGVIGVIGKRKAKGRQAEAERANASFLREQAEFAEISGKRELNIFERQSDRVIGAQQSAFAKAGVDLSGSALAVLAESKQQAAEEKGAIRRESEFRVRLANLRAQEAEGAAGRLEGGLFGDILGGVIGAGADVAGGLIAKGGK